MNISAVSVMLSQRDGPEKSTSESEADVSIIPSIASVSTMPPAQDATT